MSIKSKIKKSIIRYSQQRTKRSFALDNLDIKLSKYIKKRKGFFIEVGANDGINQSNSLYFEKYLGWNGLLIEPIPILAQQCRENRPNCIVENCALVADNYPKKNIEITYCNLMSFVNGGFKNKSIEERHLLNGLKFLKDDEASYKIHVPAHTLNFILEKHNIIHIDLLSLDVEGYEPNVLHGLNFDRYSPEFMLIEVWSNNEIETIISHRYKPIAILNVYQSHSDVLYKLNR